MMFRWLVLAVLLAALGVAASRARRTKGNIPRTRILVVSPLLFSVLVYLVNPRWMAWSSLNLPSGIRWIGVALGIVVVASAYWVLRTFGANVGNPDLTKREYQLVTSGPYRRVRHPMYAVGIATALSLGLMAANWFILLWAIILFIAIRFIVIPREEARLIEMFGDQYRHYREQTGLLLPFPAIRSGRRR